MKIERPFSPFGITTSPGVNNTGTESLFPTPGTTPPSDIPGNLSPLFARPVSTAAIVEAKLVEDAAACAAAIASRLMVSSFTALFKSDTADSSSRIF